MLKVNLAELRRRGTLSLEEGIPPEAGLWKGSDLHFGGDLDARFEVSLTGGGQVLAGGRLTGCLRHACRRCLAEVMVEMDQEVQLVYAPPDQLSAGEAGGEIRELPVGASELDLAQAVREEVILTAPIYVVCREECRGLCPHCGANWNESDCECTLEEPDPRWEVLRGLRQE